MQLAELADRPDDIYRARGAFQFSLGVVVLLSVCFVVVRQVSAESPSAKI
jgi:hypothetical protein